MCIRDRGKTGAITVAYTPQEEVIKGVLDELKLADQEFANGVTFSGDPTPYNGDPKKWRRASNAFALQILISLSKRTESSTINVKQRFAEIVNGGFLLEPTTGFLGLNYSSTNVHPMLSLIHI